MLLTLNDIEPNITTKVDRPLETPSSQVLSQTRLSDYAADDRSRHTVYGAYDHTAERGEESAIELGELLVLGSGSEHEGAGEEGGYEADVAEGDVDEDQGCD